MCINHGVVCAQPASYFPDVNGFYRETGLAVLRIGRSRLFAFVFVLVFVPFKRSTTSLLLHSLDDDPSFLLEIIETRDLQTLGRGTHIKTTQSLLHGG